jgi:peroxiredoxin
MTHLDAGDPAPDFALTHRPGEEPVRLSDHRGEPVVLLFFPLAFSSVCTAEMCRVAEDWERWREVGGTVLGISVDSPFVNLKFAAECGARFPILSDFNREASDVYGVLNDDYFGMKGVADRAAFVIDGEGTVRWAWHTDDDSVMPDFERIRDEVAKLG